MFVPAEIIIKNGNTEWWNLCIWELKKNYNHQQTLVFSRWQSEEYI